MKLAALLAKYLYTHNRMELPGLGVFILDPQIPSGEKSTMLEGVFFENRPSIRESPDLIRFISSETGKMKALAAADLGSHLELALQFLHMGKPFLFEGIGSLVKLRSGEYAFTAGPATPEVLPVLEPQIEKGEGTQDDYKSIFYTGGRSRPSAKKALTMVLAIGGIALALWGGYTVYQRTNTQNLPEPVEEPLQLTAPVVADTIRKAEPIIAAPSGQLSKKKFILETAQAKRAFARYNKLKSFQWNVEMETNDSVLYTLYVMMPAAAIDTVRIMDSLTRMNGRRVYIQ